MRPVDDDAEADGDPGPGAARAGQPRRSKGSGPQKPTGLEGSDPDDIPAVRCGFTAASIGTLSPMAYPQVKKTGLASLLTTRASGGGDNKMYWELLMRIDPVKRTLRFPDGEVRPMDEVAVELITGIKSGSVPIPVGIEPTSIKRDRKKVQDLLGLRGVGRGKIKVAQVLSVLRSIDPRSQDKKDLDAANVGYTLLVCATMLAPQATSRLVPDEVLHCVTDPDKISSFNWGKYILDNIMQHARKVQQHYKDKIGVCPMGGFQLFVQVCIRPTCMHG